MAAHKCEATGVRAMYRRATHNRLCLTARCERARRFGDCAHQARECFNLASD